MLSIGLVKAEKRPVKMVTFWGICPSEEGRGRKRFVFGQALICWNTGNRSLLPADDADLNGSLDSDELLPVDIDGNPRVVGGEVDMGGVRGPVSCLELLMIVRRDFETGGGFTALRVIPLCNRPLAF